jgi:hypothetical protein
MLKGPLRGGNDEIRTSSIVEGNDACSKEVTSERKAIGSRTPVQLNIENVKKNMGLTRFCPSPLK